jgi:hypothetical protein
MTDEEMCDTQDQSEVQSLDPELEFACDSFTEPAALYEADSESDHEEEDVQQDTDFREIGQSRSTGFRLIGTGRIVLDENTIGKHSKVVQIFVRI